jgi:hypothetical protein
MNKKGQLGFLKVISFAIIFIIFFALALAPFVNTALDIANLSEFGTLGVWLIGSFNLWILLAFVLLIVSAILMGINTGGGNE